MYDDVIIKDSLVSVMELGESSPLFSTFLEICLCFSCSTLCNKKNIFLKNELLAKLGGSTKDLAWDCIADLFARKDKKFIHINKYFENKYPRGTGDVKPCSISLQLRALIKSRTCQRISELREDTGEIYFKVKKSIETFLHREKNEFASLNLDGIKYFYRVQDWNNKYLPDDYPQERLIAILLSHSFSTKNIAEVIRSLFNIINSQSIYKRAISEQAIIITIRDYLLERMNEFLITAKPAKIERKKRYKAGLGEE